MTPHAMGSSSPDREGRESLAAKKNPPKLKAEVKKSLVASQFTSGFEFLPEGAIDKLFTNESVAKMLKDSELTAYTLTNAKKVFAILLLLDLPPKYVREGMKQVWQRGICDHHLPLTESDWNERGLPMEDREDSDDSDEEDIIDVWTDTRIDTFCKKLQWIVLAPVFSINEPGYDLGPSCVLPFPEKIVKWGGTFGDVSRCEIHPSHLLDPSNQQFQCPQYVAVKELRDAGDRQKLFRSWEKEADILRKMNKLEQPHIVRFFTAFKRGIPGNESHYLMFEWADGGNLRDFWKTFNRPALNANLVKATVRQILGLAEAISRAHYPVSTPSPSGMNFRHGDLKPENILWFKDGGDRDGIGTFKIGDWGLAKQHQFFTELRSFRTTTSGGTRIYEPPEEAASQGAKLLVPGRTGKKRSRLYDIWAMGCITLEFLIWLVYGYDQAQQFIAKIIQSNPNAPRFYQVRQDNINQSVATVHEVAEKWMDHMAKDPIFSAGETALGNVLELLRKRLLVVKLPERLGTSDFRSNDIMTPRRDALSDGAIVADPVDHSTTSEMAKSSTRDIPGIVLSEPEETQAEPTQETPGIVVTEPEAPQDSQDADPKLFSRLFSKPGWERARSDQFYDSMLEIAGEDEKDSYWFTGPPNPSKGPYADIVHVIRQGGTYQAVDSEGFTESRKHGTAPKSESAQVAGLVVPSSNQVVPGMEYGPAQLGTDWNLEVDNDFAERVLGSVESKNLELPEILPASNLCDTCQGTSKNLWNLAFSVQYDAKRLEESARMSCDLCRLLWKTYQRHTTIQVPTVTFERDGTFLKMNGDGPSVLSICRSPDLSTRISPYIQIGYPGLFKASSEAHLEVIRQWLNLCDSDHSVCRRTAPTTGRTGSKVIHSGSSSQSSLLPTRVISVGVLGDQKVHLLETGPKDHGEWIALSHQWGNGNQFCTTTRNREAHINGIDFDSLPDTFKHAVVVTRALGRPYLWIDSLCIIQGKDGDFNQEAKNMERVYSSAYCVLASSRSPGHYAGFLQNSRNPRDTVVLRQDKTSKPFYISEIIDNFGLHVLNGSLNKRGWVLQEHALARRTVYFTDHQTYFECGDGVRCETMTKMTNNLATLLGDPAFPTVIMRAGQGERILRYQDLYSRYSRLGLSKDHDRTMAIDGLQDRILKALGVQGGYGIFDEGNEDGKNRGLLRRSLLWRRGSDVPSLERIAFPKDHPIARVPSWSWMACNGGIDYISPSFGGVDWERMSSPWSQETGGLNHKLQTDKIGGNVALIAEARDYNTLNLRKGQGEIVLDRPGGSQQPATKCVVLGKQQPSTTLGENMREHYLLIVASTNRRDRDGRLIYERVGAGYLPGKFIASTGETIRIH